jgi:tetratricopeptide (TPR) repeat protein
MGTRSFVRSAFSIARAYQRHQVRESKRIQRELELQHKLYAKMSELQQAELEFKEFLNHIDRLTSIHKDCAEFYDWIELEKTLPPSQPIFGKKPEKDEVQDIHKEENVYREMINNYSSGFFAKLFGIDKKNIKRWENELEIGRITDAKNTIIAKEKAENEYIFAVDNYNKQCEEQKKRYEEEYKEYTGLINLAKKINGGDLSSYAYIVQDTDPFNEISEFGSEVEYTINSKTKAKAIIKVHDDTVIPKQSKTLSKSGKLIVKDIAVGKFNEIYQDYICSASIRIARDLFAILPLLEIIVTAKGNCLDKSTGKIDIVPLLSVLFIRETMEKLNFDSIDPSDAMKNFKCNMAFKKSQGMVQTKELDF